jgi:hypothetical protein
VTQAKDGNEGEEPWTVMNLDGLECVSAGVHVVGIMVGYAGYSSNKMTPSREGSIVEAFDMTMLPASRAGRGTPVLGRTACWGGPRAGEYSLAHPVSHALSLVEKRPLVHLAACSSGVNNYR